MSSSIGFFKIIGQIGGIGGLALGVFFLLFREVIRLKIFPTLDRERSYRLLRIILILVWSIAVTGLAIWGYALIKPDPKFMPGRLAVTDVSVNDYNPDFNATVDFRVANRGNRPLSINRIRFIVVETKEVLTAGMLPFSGRYDLDISDLKKVGDYKDVIVSQVLQAGEVDRFAVVLTARAMGGGVFRLWRLNPRIFSSEGETALAESVGVGLPWNLAVSTAIPGSSTGRPDAHFSCEPVGRLTISSEDESNLDSHEQNNFVEAQVLVTFVDNSDIQFTMLPSGSSYLTSVISGGVSKRLDDIKRIAVSFKNKVATCNPIEQ